MKYNATDRRTALLVVPARSCLSRAAPKRTEEEMVKREKEGRREMEEMEAMSKRKKCRGEQ